MVKIQDVTDMPVYRAFHELALKVEKTTKQFGPEFRWLRVQSLRSSESVCANMAEGFYSQYSTEYLQSLYRCRREARETMTHLQYSLDVSQSEEDAVHTLMTDYEKALAQLACLIGSIERKISERGKAKPATQVRESQIDYQLADLDTPEVESMDSLPIDH